MGEREEYIGKSLYDIRKWIDEIDQFTRENGRRFDTFRDNLMFQRAVQHDLSLIGESVNRILKIEPDIQITSARSIVNMRNLIIHAYDSLRLDQLWNIVINHLPKLGYEVDVLMKIYLDALEGAEVDNSK